MDNNVIFWKDERLIITNDILKDMKYKALHNGMNKFRYCFHENKEALIHEMLFTNTRQAYFRPHSHTDDEYQIMVDGKMYVIYFDDDGRITDYFISSPQRNRIYRINQNVWHMNLPLTKTVTILEVKKGPFHANSNRYPDWAPELTHTNEVRKYVRRIKTKLLEARLSRRRISG